MLLHWNSANFLHHLYHFAMSRKIFTHISTSKRPDFLSWYLRTFIDEITKYLIAPSNVINGAFTLCLFCPQTYAQFFRINTFGKVLRQLLDGMHKFKCKISPFWWQNSQTSKQFQIYLKILINHQNGFFLTVHVEIPFNSFHGSLVNAPRASQRKPIQFSHWATCTLVCARVCVFRRLVVNVCVCM